MRRSAVIGCFLALFLLTATGYAQRSRESLEAEIRTLQAEIETANRLLAETSKSREVTLSQVSLMDRKIKNRQKLIDAYKEQIRVLEASIKRGERNITALNGELKTQRQEYAKMVVFAYRNKSHYDRLEFLFSSEDFNQAFQRMRYIQQFAEARRNKMTQIASTQQRVRSEVDAQKRDREQQAALLAEEKQQQEVLIKEKAELNTQLAALRKKEGSIQQSIRDKQAQARQFQQEIDRIIAEEIRRANAANPRTDRSDKMALTPSEKVLSTSFSANKGKLPWPVERGMVSSPFGRHASAVSEKVLITNNGVDIATTENAKARCVFEGVVVSVVKPSATNIGVIVRHGDYFTVYSQLDEVYVSRGDHVSTKQNIGRVHTDRSEGKTEVHFELRQGTECLNPELWLSK